MKIKNSMKIKSSTETKNTKVKTLKEMKRMKLKNTSKKTPSPQIIRYVSRHGVPKEIIRPDELIGNCSKGKN